MICEPGCRIQVEIRQKHDSIERKQKDLDRLNRRMEEIIKSKGSLEEAENTGPLEATVNSLTKAVAGKSKEAEELEREWIKKQSELVEYLNRVRRSCAPGFVSDFETQVQSCSPLFCALQIDSMTKSLQDARSEQAVLEQKRRRLECACVNVELSFIHFSVCWWVSIAV